MTVVLVPRLQAGEQYTVALLGDSAERMGHLVLLAFRKRRTNSHSTSKLALRILSVVPWFESLHQLVDLVRLAIEIGDAVAPRLGRKLTHLPDHVMLFDKVPVEDRS